MLAPRTRSGAGLVNLRQIADRAGVSIATVSRVLNGSSNRISQTTRDRVVAIAEELGYRPNLLIRSIQEGRTRTVGVMVPPYDSFWAEVLYGVHDELYTLDHVALMLWVGHEAHDEQYWADMRRKVYRMIDQRVDGAILWPPFAALYGELLREFSSRDLPVVTIDHRLDEPGVDGVGGDETRASRAVAEHLLKLGHKRFAHLGGSRAHTWAQERRAGFVDTVRAARGCDLVCVDTDREEEAHRLADELLDRSPRPTAFFAASDRYARALYRAAARRGLRIPDDLSVVGAGDADFSLDLSPPLSTLRQKPYEMGRKAAALVVARSRGDRRNAEPVYDRLPLELVLRRSTAPPPAG